MTTAATHNGTCQFCGNQHAVNARTGLLADHGYTLDYGFQNGTCIGSRQLPAEKSTQLARARINSARREAADMERSLSRKDKYQAESLERHARHIEAHVLPRLGMDLIDREQVEREAQAAKAEKAAKPTKVSVKREIDLLNQQMEELFKPVKQMNREEQWAANTTNFLDLPFYLHHYNAKKHAADLDRYVPGTSAKVEALVAARQAAKDSLK